MASSLALQTKEEGVWRGWVTIGQGSQNRDRCTRRVSRLQDRGGTYHIGTPEFAAVLACMEQLPN